ncbi:hypothetical protein FB446DRAFT_739071 [Lentinula raphanica]|nr:hypothetical protein FB446DRAFT_739071 [Lentinula raphanica]
MPHPVHDSRRRRGPVAISSLSSRMLSRLSTHACYALPSTETFIAADSCIVVGLFWLSVKILEGTTSTASFVPSPVDSLSVKSPLVFVRCSSAFSRLGPIPSCVCPCREDVGNEHNYKASPPVVGLWTQRQLLTPTNEMSLIIKPRIEVLASRAS